MPAFLPWWTNNSVKWNRTTLIHRNLRHTVDVRRLFRDRIHPAPWKPPYHWARHPPLYKRDHFTLWKNRPAKVKWPVRRISWLNTACITRLPNLKIKKSKSHWPRSCPIYLVSRRVWRKLYAKWNIIYHIFYTHLDLIYLYCKYSFCAIWMI